MDLCDGLCPQFHRLKDGHNQQIEGLMRWRMDNVRNFIVLKTAIISSLMDLRDGQRP